jgi:hypothetical protein
MKEAPALMPRTAPSSQPLPQPHLRRRDATLLVLGVLAAHVWVLSGSPTWVVPDKRQPLQTKAFTTRQIEVEAPRPAQQAPAAVSQAPLAPAPVTTSPSTTGSPPLKFDDFGHDLTAPVGLPARSAEGVDLPPYNRASSGMSGLTEATNFKAPEPAVLSYQVQGTVKGLNYWASSELQWLPKGQSYEARLEVGALFLGSRTQISKGELGAEGIMPTRFGDKTRSELAAHFQRDKGIISFSANSPDAPLLKGAQDRLSVVLQISSLLAGDPGRFPAGTMLSFQTVSQREAEVWHFLVDKDETLQLPYGELSALKLTRKPRREFDQTIELWFAPTLGYLPVRLRITNANGDVVDQVLKKAEKPSS